MLCKVDTEKNPRKKICQRVLNPVKYFLIHFELKNNNNAISLL